MKTKEEIASAEANLNEQIALLKLKIEHNQLLVDKLEVLKKEISKLKK